ncbi:MAG: hypothetical protein EPO32_13240 [Anaerolineae bacterium]|nr:MAG: hypothetical protein EPO32_13240 [Anaerolineae bacterium]
MKRFLNSLLAPDGPDVLGQVLGAWRPWLAGALLGALAGWAVFAVFPPPTRAQASVIVDFNIEESWVYFPERRLFHFLEREVRKLEAVAWSDAVIEQVAVQTGHSVPDLRGGVLLLSQPQEGEWHLLAESRDPAEAEALAAAWAQTFVTEARLRVGISPELEALRARVNTAYANGEDMDAETLERLGAEIGAAIEAAQGLSPYLILEVSQVRHLPAEPATSRGGYLLIGSLAGALLLALAALFRGGGRVE